MHLASQHHQDMSKCSKGYSIAVPVELFLYESYLSMLLLHILYTSIVEWEDDSDYWTGISVKEIGGSVSLFTVPKTVKELIK